MEVYLFLFGICVGSFVNVLIDRLPQGMDIFGGRSVCDYCKKTLRWFELIPIASFLIQLGLCRRCRKPLSWQYPIVEFSVGIGFVVLSDNIATLLIFLSLVIIFVSDLKYEIIPDSMIGVGLVGTILYGHTSWLAAGAAAGFFFFLWLITRGRGMGFGDVKLVFLLGLILGFPAIGFALYVAFLTGACVGLILILLGRRKLKSHIPFGPFLIIGTSVALLYGSQMMVWWNKLQ